MATGSRPASGGKIEIETADDFILSQNVVLNQGTFTGLIPAGISPSAIGAVGVEIYRIFPLDSVNPPSGNVPTRVNSPSDVALATRDSSAGTLSFNASILSATFTAANSVLNGIHPKPNQTTLGEGPVTGQEVRFNVTFSTPLDLPAGHYFFVPQVELTGGDFLWLSAAKPTEPPFTPDLQTWIRDANLDPDWLRVGTDIVGGSPAPTYNASFSLAGEAVPDVSSTFTWLGFACLGLFIWRAHLRPQREPSLNC